MQVLRKQLEDERREQKKLLAVLASVIKGEVPGVSLAKPENVLVNFLISCIGIHKVLLRLFSNCKGHWLHSRRERVKLLKGERL